MATTAATLAAESDGPTRRVAPEWVIFGSGGECFAVPLDQVREILLPQPITRLPGCGPEICGLVGLRGGILTAFDIGAILELQPAVSVPDHRLLMLECRGQVVAGAVESVLAVTNLAAAESAAVVADDGWRVSFDESVDANSSIDTARRERGERARVARALDLDDLLGRYLA
jgi:purine-binding chemotaxis protein CheW